MNTKNLVVMVIATLALIVSVSAFATKQHSVSFPPKGTFGAAGGLLAENYDPYIQYNGGYNSAKSIKTTGDLTVGSSGTTIGQIIEGTGILIAPNYTSLAASTTFAGDVAVTGVVSGDNVFAQFATSTANGAGWEIVGANASSTSGFITVRWINNTGTTASIPASVASTTKYVVFH